MTFKFVLTSLLLVLSVVIAIQSLNVPSGNLCGINGHPVEYNCRGKRDGNYPHPSKCTHYIACTAGIVACEIECAQNHTGTPLHYVQNSGPSPQTSRCDYPEVANCNNDGCNYAKSNKIIPQANRCSIGGVPFNYDCSGHADGNYPHPKKCTHYIACTAQLVACEMECAGNHTSTPLHYVQDSGPSPQTSRCDYPEVANCHRECNL
ncbi:unnamed protein product [Allacma fusca]|uniref:Chitin-binding type-2 domain-containing protein n=1 Tax=Allacma fusca TaxID=39272 RepID=A0A8J2L394_9HEXA|nr:unnamed protein product [Allacma fusca]